MYILISILYVHILYIWYTYNDVVYPHTDMWIHYINTYNDVVYPHIDMWIHYMFIRIRTLYVYTRSVYTT